MQFIESFKKLGTDAATYGLSTAIGRMISLIMAPILTRIFAPSDYGVIALVQLAVGLVVVCAGMNLGSGITYYYFKNEDEKERAKLLTSGYAVVLALSFLIAFAMYALAPQIEQLLHSGSGEDSKHLDLVLYLKISAVGLFFGLAMSVAQTILRILGKAKKYFLVELTSLLVNLVCVLVLVVWLRVGIEGVFYAGVISSIAGLLIGILFVYDRFASSLSILIVLPILTYSLPQMPGVLVNWLQSQTGRFFINYYSTLTEQGLYSIALTIASLLVLVTTAFRLAYDPYAVSIMKSPDAKNIYAKTFSVYALIFGCFLGFVVAFAKPMLVVLTPSEYHAAHKMVFLLAAAGFLMGLNNILATGIWLSRRTVFTSYAQIITLIVVVIATRIMVPDYFAFGAAFSFLLGSFAQSLAYYWFAQRLINIPYKFWRVMIFVAVTICVGWFHSFYVDSMSFFTSVLFGLCTFILMCIISLYIITTRDERKFAFKYLRNRYSKHYHEL